MQSDKNERDNITPILAFIDAHASQHKPREEAGIAEAPAGSLTSALY